MRTNALLCLLLATAWLTPSARAADCNQNGIDDTIDVAEGTSQDCKLTGRLDECDLQRGDDPVGTFEITELPGPDGFAATGLADSDPLGLAGANGDVAIGGLSSPTLDRSARIVITGAGFGVGGAGSDLLIDGLPAIVTVWTDARIVGYVPEDASLGDVDVFVSTPAGDSQTVTLEVTPRTHDGQVRWRFAVEGDYMIHAPGVGPGGEVYVNDLDGRLYALSADGGLMWMVDALRGQPGGASEGRVVVAADGTIFVGVNPLGPTVELVAYSPDGTLRWVHTDPGAVRIGAGPTIGPDGDVYVCYEGLNGPALGLVRLTPEGEVLWTNNGEPTFWEQGGLGADVAFAPDELGDGPPTQAVVTFDLGSQRHVYGFDLADGDQRFAVGANNLDASGQTQLVVSIDGTIVMPESAIAGAGGWGLQALDPSDGSEMWVFDPQAATTISNPTVGVDGSFYFTWDGRRIQRVSPSGEEEWLYVADAGSHRSATPSPANDVLISTGIAGGDTGIIRANTVQTGAEVFLVELPDENGGVLLPSHDVVFTEDGATAYVTAFIAGDHPDSTYSYVYAIAGDGTATTGMPTVGWPGVRAPQLRLASANPSSWGMEFALDAPVHATAHLVIYDVQGRTVARVGANPAAELRRLTWDGRDARGRRVPAGVYLARLLGDVPTQPVRFVIAR